MKPPSFFQKAEWFPPIVCRLLARQQLGGPPMSTDQISVATGLPAITVEAISQQLDWRGIDLPTMLSWLWVTGCNFDDPVVYKRMRVYLRGPKIKGLRIPAQFTYLRKSPNWASYYSPLLQRYVKSKRRAS